MKDKMCSECNVNIATFITRENKQSPAIPLCAQCANNRKYLKWGIVSYHTNIESEPKIVDINKKVPERDISVIEGLQRKTRRASKKSKKVRGKIK